MIPDLSLPKRMTALLLLISIPTLLAVILTLSVSAYKKANQLHGDSEQIKKVSGLIKVADSIRDSSPFSALVCYHKAILMLKVSTEGKENFHHPSKAYFGIACINSTNSNYKETLKNDSIAMSLARRQLRQLIPKTLLYAVKWKIFLQ